MKEMFNVWEAKFLLTHFIDAKKLQHENDGLIFTIDECPYYPGTCNEILKWKPIELNSIDFKLEKTPNASVYQLKTSDDRLFSFLVVESEPTQYLAGNAVVECIYDKTKDDQTQLAVNSLTQAIDPRHLNSIV
jgi:mRNA-capping enzyme